MSGPHEDPDVFSMSRLREGDDLALNEIMDRWQRRLTSYLIRLTGSEAVAMDLAQETFVRVYQNRAPPERFQLGSLPSLRIWRDITSAGRSGTPV
jgi:DNA-directed RNA polymerase specialized sigma24 family protein